VLQQLLQLQDRDKFYKADHGPEGIGLGPVSAKMKENIRNGHSICF
jgi:hypothetical protein